MSRPVLIRFGLSLLSAVMLFLAVPTFGLWPLMWVALVPMMWVALDASTHKRAFLYGWLTGTAANAVEVDLQPGQEEEKREAERREGVDDAAGLGQVEYLGADDDAEHELEHDHRDADARQVVGDDRCRYRDRGDDEQRGEVLRHAQPSGEWKPVT